MKKLLLVLLALPLLYGCNQNVNIPDANFKAFLVNNSNINTNGDTEISVTEAAAFNGAIYCQGMGISNLTGIEAFTALTKLYCYNNQLTSLNVSQNTALTSLGCGNNQLTSLNVSQNTALTSLYCNSNQLTRLDVRNGNNTNFSEFYAFGNSNLYCIDVDDATWSTANWTGFNFIFDSQSYFSNNYGSK
jgi:Leucine-rich repeat (LRR) protein